MVRQSFDYILYIRRIHMNRLYMVTESILLNLIFWSILYQAEFHAAIPGQNQGKTEVDSKCCSSPYKCRAKTNPPSSGLLY